MKKDKPLKSTLACATQWATSDSPWMAKSSFPAKSPTTSTLRGLNDDFHDFRAARVGPSSDAMVDVDTDSVEGRRNVLGDCWVLSDG